MNTSIVSVLGLTSIEVIHVVFSEDAVDIYSTPPISSCLILLSFFSKPAMSIIIALLLLLLCFNVFLRMMPITQ